MQTILRPHGSAPAIAAGPSSAHAIRQTLEQVTER
jgi:hypothetical protein